jgi:hypothetical protein
MVVITESERIRRSLRQSAVERRLGAAGIVVGQMAAICDRACQSTLVPDRYGDAVRDVYLCDFPETIDQLVLPRCH